MTKIIRENTGGSGNDPDAIHDNVAGEIDAITLKATPVNADLLIIEDSAAGNAKKKATAQSIAQLGGANIQEINWTVSSDNVTSEAILLKSGFVFSEEATFNSGRLSSVSYLTSLDDDLYTARPDLTGVGGVNDQNGSDLFIKVVAVYQSGETGITKIFSTYS